MRRFRFNLQVLLLAAMFGLGVFAHAQNSKQAFVSATGNDNNQCLRDSSCRTLVRAVAATAQTGGEVIVLDSSEYGQVAINN